jgi:hypothetical protein
MESRNQNRLTIWQLIRSSTFRKEYLFASALGLFFLAFLFYSFKNVSLASSSGDIITMKVVESLANNKSAVNIIHEDGKTETIALQKLSQNEFMEDLSANSIKINQTANKIIKEGYKLNAMSQVSLGSTMVSTWIFEKI